MNELHNVLVAVDVSSGCAAALRQAARIAGLAGAKLHLVHVIDGLVANELADLPPGIADTVRRKIVKDAHARVGGWMSELIEQAELSSVWVDIGDPAREIATRVRALHPGLLVVGVRGASVGATPGTVTSRTLHRVAADVLVVHHEKHSRYRRLLVGFDFSQASYRALGAAMRLAALERAALHLLHVYEPSTQAADAQAELVDALHRRVKAAVREARTQQPEIKLKIRSVLREGANPARELVAYAREVRADLVVVGMRHHPLREVLLGSTAERVLEGGAASVLAVRTSG